MTPLLPIAIVLPGAHRWHRLNVIHYATKLDMLPVLLLQQGDDRTGITAEALVLEWSNNPDEEELQKLATEINHHCSSWYILALDDYISESAAKLSPYASRPCYPLEAANIAFHKHLLRNLWNHYCANNPHLPLQPADYALYHSSEKIECSIGFEKNNSAFIIKPDAYSGSVGVLRALVKSEVEGLVQKCSNILQNEAINPEMNGIDIGRNILVEEEIPRKQNLAGCAEFTAHYLSLNGEHYLLGIAEKTIHPTTYIETSHTFPSHHFPLHLITALHTATSELLSELQVQNTLSNWEFIITPNDRLALIEGQLRPSGDHVMELVENACLISPYTLFFQSLSTGQFAVNDVAAKLTSIILWPRPSIVLDKVLDIQTPTDLPIGIHLVVDMHALTTSSHWPGPISWYHRHISIMSTAATALIAKQQIEEIIKACTLEGIRNGINASTTLTADKY